MVECIGFEQRTTGKNIQFQEGQINYIISELYRLRKKHITFYFGIKELNEEEIKEFVSKGKFRKEKQEVSK